MEHRQEHDEAVAFGNLKDALDAFKVGKQVAIADQCAFGMTCRAGSVNNMRQIIDFRLVAQIGRTRKTARFFKTRIGFVRRFRLAYPNDFLDAGLFFQPLQFFLQTCRSKHKPRFAVVQNIRVFVVFQKRIHRYGNRADGGDGKIGADKLRRIGYRQSHFVAEFDAHILQICGYGIDFLLERVVGGFFFVVEHRSTFAVFTAGSGQHFVEICVVCLIHWNSSKIK